MMKLIAIPTRDGMVDFLRDHKQFTEDITQAVERLEEML
jgi:hypothetical protein